MTDDRALWKNLNREGMCIYITALLISLLEFIEGHWAGGIGWIMVFGWAWLYYSERVFFLRMKNIAEGMLEEMRNERDDGEK